MSNKKIEKHSHNVANKADKIPKRTIRKLTKKQRGEVVRLYATGSYTMQQLGDTYGITKQSISSLVANHSESFLQYKKEYKDRLERKMSIIADKAQDHAVKNIKKLSPYQAFMVSAISHDKLYPKETIQIGDNRTMNITFSNFNKNSPKADTDPQAK